MFKRVFWLMVLLVAGGGAAVATIERYCPGLWTAIAKWASGITSWTEEGREADPVAFIAYASQKLTADLETMSKARRELAAQIGELSERLRHHQALRDQARCLAEEFRAKYQEAKAKNRFPIEVCGAPYSAEQAKAQVSLLLTEAKGYEAAVGKLREVRKEAEAQLEVLTVQIDRTEAELAALAAQREMLRGRKVVAAQKEVLAQVETLLKGNAQVLASDPVRNVQGLLAATRPPKQQRTHDQALEAFLAQGRGALVPRIAYRPTSAPTPSPRDNRNPAGNPGEHSPPPRSTRHAPSNSPSPGSDAFAAEQPKLAPSASSEPARGRVTDSRAKPRGGGQSSPSGSRAQSDNSPPEVPRPPKRTESPNPRAAAGPVSPQVSNRPTVAQPTAVVLQPVGDSLGRDSPRPPDTSAAKRRKPIFQQF